MTNVVNFSEDYSSEYSGSDKFWTLKRMHMWTKELTPSEYMVLMFIWNRTVFWSKKEEYISFRHFRNGIPGTIAGLPFGKSRLSEIIKSLQDKKIIERDMKPWGSRYKIKFNKKINKNK